MGSFQNLTSSALSDVKEIRKTIKKSVNASQKKLNTSSQTSGPFLLIFLALENWDFVYYYQHTSALLSQRQQ